MQDVIAKMVAVENEAKRLVEAAEAEAAALVRTAGEQAQRERSQNLEAARVQARELIATAGHGAEEERGRLLAKGRETTARLVALPPERLSEAAETVVRAALGGK
jgi:vacuolar-type H+-ATPase subunit H